MKLSDSLAQNKSVLLQAEATDWQQAVKLGVDLLVAAEVVEPAISTPSWPALNDTALFCIGSGAGDAARSVRKKGY
jgi:hypothetical protein